jgi:hypothetical protein
VEFNIEWIDIAQGNPEALINRFIRPFDLSQAPLIRVGLLKTEEERYILMIDMHHIISDAISHSILVEDFMSLYQERELSPLKLQYKDFSEWQRKNLHTDYFKKQEEYWLNKFRGEIPVLELPTDYPRPAVQRFEGNTITSQIEEIITEKLRGLVAEQGATLYIVLLASFILLLSKYSDQNDIIVGSPVAGRSHADLDHIVGMFVNVVLIRNTIDAQRSFREFLEDVKHNTLKSFENQDYPIDRLAGQLEIKREPGRNPLYEVIFAMLNTGMREFTLPGLELKPFKHSREDIKTDLRLGAMEVNEKIILTLTYSTALFKKETSENMLRHYLEIINQIVADEAIKIEDIKISHDLVTLSSNVFKEDNNEFNF